MRAALLVLLLAAPVFAHPPVSVVIDPDGNVFYSDLVHVWFGSHKSPVRVGPPRQGRPLSRMGLISRH